MNKLVKITLTAAALLIVYGILVKAAGIRFFWESSALGWDLGFIGCYCYWRSNKRKRKPIGKSGQWNN